ncbi:MAG: hypothetical protein ACUVSX_03860 [Aggregatilineales bacterium]
MNWSTCPRRFVVGAIALLLTAGCAADVPTPTPTRALSGPTTAPTANPFFAGPPTEPPPDIVGGPGRNDPTAAALPNQAALPPLPVGPAQGLEQAVELAAPDGALLTGALLAHSQARMPGLLVLAQDRPSWDDFPARLHAAGFTVLVMQPRPDTARADIPAMLEALGSGIADPARIGVIGAGTGADAALRGCAAAPICAAAALLSPLDPALTTILFQYNPRPLFIAASAEDAQSYAIAQQLAANATGDALLQPLERAGQGTAILQNRPDVGELLIAWLQRQFRA